MVLEIADIRIRPGEQAAFAEAIQRALRTIVNRAEGMRSYRVSQGIESPERYVLQIQWDTLEAHTVGFRESPLFAEWRALIGPFFAQPPVVEHFNLLAES